MSLSLNLLLSRKWPSASAPPPIASTLIARDPVQTSAMHRQNQASRVQTADVHAIRDFTDLIHKFGFPHHGLADARLPIGPGNDGSA